MAELSELIADVAQKWGTELTEDIRTSAINKGHDASGSLIASFKPLTTVEPDGVHFVLEAEDYYEFPDKGRLPTKSGGDGALYRSLTGFNGWLATGKGATILQSFMADNKLKDRVKANKALSFLIARKIHKFGYKGTNYFSEVVTDQRIEELYKLIEEAMGGDDFIIKAIED